MSADDLIRRWFEEVWTKGRDSAVDEMIAPGAVIHGMTNEGETLSGPAGFRQFYNNFRQSFTEVRVTVGETVLQGDRAAARFTFTAVHSGAGLGFPATGKTVRSTGMVMIHARDGKIIEGWNEFDAAGMMRQLQSAATSALLV